MLNLIRRAAELLLTFSLEENCPCVNMKLNSTQTVGILVPKKEPIVLSQYKNHSQNHSLFFLIIVTNVCMCAQMYKCNLL